MSYVVQLSGVTKRFGTKTAVDQLDLRVPEGAIYGFIGPNGSGKTTTIRMILRIFQPDEGRVWVLGRDQGQTADDRVGYLPEERGLYKRMKVRDVLAYYARLKGFRQCQAEINHWLERLEAADWAEKRVEMLSKGMAQKVQFIAAVVARPQLVILDEPFSGLDPVNLEVLRDAVLSLREAGSTIIFSTHDMEVAERLCDTIFMIFEGRKVLDGTLDEIQQQFPSNLLRVRLRQRESPPELAGLVQTPLERNGFWEMPVREGTDPQHVLRVLVDQCQIEHFEVARPSLHDIFVNIVRPDLLRRGEAGIARQVTES